VQLPSRPVIQLAEEPFADTARAVLEQFGEVLPLSALDDGLSRAEAIVCGLQLVLDRQLLDRAPTLRVIASRTSQLRHVDLEETGRRGIEVLWIDPAAPLLQQTPSTAEAAWALLLALARNVPWAFTSVSAGRWERARYGGRELSGSVLGVVGLGRIGRMITRYAHAFGMSVVAFDPYVDQDVAMAFDVQLVPLDQLLASSDVVSIHCTWSDETRGLLGRRELALMKPTSLLVNTARGEIVDEAELLEALQEHRLAGAAIDTLADEQPDGSHVLHNPLVEHARLNENLIILPHLGGATAEATERTQRYISERLVNWLEEH
jgi:D-3-phosphoglycerate dehydrogenase / 2-oxoglutarate reductase